jgi:hypothetical protein
MTNGRGPKGERGERGAEGKKGMSAAQIALLAITIFALVAAFSATAYAIRAVQNEATERCQENAQNRTAIRDSISAGLHTGAKGTAGYAYYQQHPDERALAIQAAKDNLKRFPVIRCGP